MFIILFSAYYSANGHLNMEHVHLHLECLGSGKIFLAGFHVSLSSAEWCPARNQVMQYLTGPSGIAVVENTKMLGLN